MHATMDSREYVGYQYDSRIAYMEAPRRELPRHMRLDRPDEGASTMPGWGGAWDEPMGGMERPASPLKKFKGMPGTSFISIAPRPYNVAGHVASGSRMAPPPPQLPMRTAMGPPPPVLDAHVVNRPYEIQQPAFPVMISPIMNQQQQQQLLPPQQQKHGQNPALSDQNPTQASTEAVMQAHRGGGDELRRNCDYCVRKKVKCNGDLPCHMCRRKGLTCVYSVKQKPGPKVRAASGRGGGSGIAGGSGSSSRGDGNRGNSRTASGEPSGEGGAGRSGHSRNGSRDGIVSTRSAAADNVSGGGSSGGNGGGEVGSRSSSRLNRHVSNNSDGSGMNRGGSGDYSSYGERSSAAGSGDGNSPGGGGDGGGGAGNSPGGGGGGGRSMSVGRAVVAVRGNHLGSLGVASGGGGGMPAASPNGYSDFGFYAGGHAGFGGFVTSGSSNGSMGRNGSGGGGSMGRNGGSSGGGGGRYHYRTGSSEGDSLAGSPANHGGRPFPVPHHDMQQHYLRPAGPAGAGSMDGGAGMGGMMNGVNGMNGMGGMSGHHGVPQYGMEYHQSGPGMMGYQSGPGTMSGSMNAMNGMGPTVTTAAAAPSSMRPHRSFSRTSSPGDSGGDGDYSEDGDAAAPASPAEGDANDEEGYEVPSDVTEALLALKYCQR